MNKNVGEKNNRSVVKDHQALHIKQMRIIQNATIKEIQKFYPDLKYNTIYRIIYSRYKHLDYLVKVVPCTEEELWHHEKK
jgi:hypothetical protein